MTRTIPARRSLRLSRALPALLGIALLAACGSAPSSAPSELTVLSSYTKGTPEGAPFYAAVDRFTKETGVPVKVVEGADKVPDLYETSVLGGQEADIVLTNLAEKSTGWVRNGVALPVDKYLDDWGLRDRVKPEALQEWRDAEGEVQGFPFAGFTWPVWYNTALLSRAGVTAPPSTTDELIDAAGKLRAAGIGPMVIGGSDWTGQKLVLQLVQQYMDPADARKLFAEGSYCKDPAAMRGLELFTQLRDGGVFIDDAQGYTADLMNAAYYNGDAAIMSAGSWAFTKAPADVAATTTLSGFPVPAGGTYTKPTAMQGGTATGIFLSPKAEDRLDDVRRFVQIMYDPATMSQFVNQAGLVPALVVQGSSDAPNPLLEQVVTTLPDRVDYAVMPDTAVPADKADALIRATAAAYAPDTDAQAICSSIDAVYAS